MSKIIIGIDPDSSKHGVAIYIDNKISVVTSMTTIDFYKYIGDEIDYQAGIDTMEIHIEDLCAIKSSSFNHHPKDSPQVKYKKSEGVGQCKHAQKEIELIAAEFGIKVVHHKVSKEWKNPTRGKPIFERVTGWTGKSNEDSRSAAYFGFLGCK